MDSDVINIRRSIFERKMTLRRATFSIPKPQEITFIDSSMLYNLLLRGISSRTKNSIIIYDFSSDQSSDKFTGDNVIRICDYPGIQEILLKGEEQIKLADFLKKLPQVKQELFEKRMRFYNFILMGGDDSNKFMQLFKSVVKQTFTEREEVCMDYLLSGGIHSANEKFFKSMVENIISDHPEIAESQAVKNWRMAFALQSLLKASKVKEVLFFKQSNRSFFKQYPFMKDYLAKLTTSTSLNFPNEVFLGRFYYGNWKNAASAELMRATCITHVLNMTQEVENYFEKSNEFQGNTQIELKYLKIDIEDVDHANIAQYFHQTNDFLENALSGQQNKVFVHCAQGKSRSASAVCVFFMRQFHWNYEATLKYICDRREIACPNQGFTKQLKQFEERQYYFNDEDDEENFFHHHTYNNQLKFNMSDSSEDETVPPNEELSETSSSGEDEEEDCIQEGTAQDTLIKDKQNTFLKNESSLGYFMSQQITPTEDNLAKHNQSLKCEEFHNHHTEQIIIQ